MSKVGQHGLKSEYSVRDRTVGSETGWSSPKLDSEAEIGVEC